MTRSILRDSDPGSDRGADPTASGSIDDIVRAIAHAPPSDPSPIPVAGDRWGQGGRYAIERRLGRGGTGTVYLATDSLLARQVALKVLDGSGSAEDEALRRRLLREARLGATLEHERVARVYDVGEHEGNAFVAMEYVRGRSLRAWMDAPHDAAETLSVIVQIAEGLAALHANGVVHRDLKPENVMLQDRGGVKLLDFGLAGHLSRPIEMPPGVLPDPGKTGRSSSTFFGTPGYMALEQCLGERADARADVFALGVTAFELVTGERPFHGPTLPELARALRDEPARLDPAAWSAFPAGLAPVVSRMLRAERSERFADGVEAHRAINAACETPQVSLAPDAPPPRPRWRRRVVIAAGVGAGLAVLGGTLGPRVARDLARRRALAKPPPPGMALIDEGTLTVGLTAEVVARQCAEQGEQCNPRVMGYQVPPARVRVAPFHLDVNEVTNRQMAVMLSNIQSSLYVELDEDHHVPRYVRFNKGVSDIPSYLLDLNAPKGGVAFEGGTFVPRAGREGWPATQVTWFGARLYCTTQGKRLPTENEWEAAARGYDDRPFPWGSAAPRCGDVTLPGDHFLPMAAGCPKLDFPVDVGTSSQDVTRNGIHDLAGNVTEWVDTAFVDGGRDLTGPPTSADSPRVLRGGSFFLSVLARTSARNKRPPTYSAYDVGFRCAADVSDIPQ